MKTRFLALLVCAAGFLSAHATEFVVGLSPFLDKGVKDDVYRRIVGMVLEDLPLKSSLSVYDAYYLTNVMRLEVPDSRAFQSGKTRANQFKDPIFKLRSFLATDHPRPTAPKLNWDQAVRLPQLMDFVRENLAGPRTLIVLGSPLYMDVKEPGFSMAEGFFPSDSHLLASREDSVYGRKTGGASAEGVIVHFGYFGDPWISALHQEKIARFWNLYLKEQGARLGAFTSDLATVFAAAKSGATPERGDEIDRSQTKPEMLRITRDQAVADWITRELPTARPRPPSKTFGPMKIGIRWKGDIDLDLYASASRDTERLYFEHTRTPEGYYFKDHRHSPEREYEFVEFETPVDAWRVQASINFYAGDVPVGADGEVRIEFEGKIYSGKFGLTASHGNKGREGSTQRDFWTRIDVPAVLGLNEQQVRAR
jgi:hypothetical protein